MDTAAKIGILADAAKYDASCSTSGSGRANDGSGVGNSLPAGICHSFSADGRCVALLKVLLTNVCAYDCAYCANRRSADLPRASFEPEELVKLIMDFYKRNYIEGAFLSSGVVGGPDATMERLISVAKTLRVRERFRGYLHLKAIPGASAELVGEAARWADRVSVNIEMPSAASLSRIAPDKTPAAIFGPMRVLARASGFEPRALPRIAPAPALSAPAALAGIPGAALPNAAGTGGAVQDSRAAWPGLAAAAPRAEPKPWEGVPLPAQDPASATSVYEARKDRYRNPGAALLPAGQTTQLVVGASPESDACILGLAENLYLAYDVRRVYYSAFLPTGTDPRVPAIPGPPLLREHRLYQADWLFRFYGFAASEILDPSRPYLDEVLDPKCDWALRNLQHFPVDLNKAGYLELLRVPGIGPATASKLLRARRSAPLNPEGLKALGVVLKRARWFISCSGRVPALEDGTRFARRPDDPGRLRAFLGDGAESALRRAQLEFDWGSAS